MARNWKDVRKHLGTEREARIKARVRDEIGHLSLNQLREARSWTQTSLAELLGIPQGGVSRLERRTDMYVSTLRNYIRAMGGELKITAVFPNGVVEISQFLAVEQQKGGGGDPAKLVQHARRREHFEFSSHGRGSYRNLMPSLLRGQMRREERHRGAFPSSRRLHGAVQYLAMLEALV